MDIDSYPHVPSFKRLAALYSARCVLICSSDVQQNYFIRTYSDIMF